MAPSAATNGAANGSTPEKDGSQGKAFQGQQPYGMPADLVIPKVMELDNTDERLWVRLLTSHLWPLNHTYSLTFFRIGPTSSRRNISPTAFQHFPRLVRQHTPGEEIGHPLAASTHWSRLCTDAQRPLALSGARLVGQ